MEMQTIQTMELQELKTKTMSELLSLSAELEIQGGQVSAESKVGECSTFSFTLPLAPAPVVRHLVEEG